MSALDHIGIKIIRALRKKINQLETEKSHLLDEIFSKKELEIDDPGIPPKRKIWTMYDQSPDRPGPPPTLDEKTWEEIDHFFKTGAEAYRNEKRIEEEMRQMNQQEQKPRMAWTMMKKEKEKIP